MAAAAAKPKSEERSQEHTFKSIREVPVPVGVKRPEVPLEIVERWVSDRTPEAKVIVGAETKVILLCGWPEKAEIVMPCLAVATFSDHIEVLNVDGKLHSFALDEVRTQA